MVFSSLPVNQFDSHDWQQQGSQHQLDCVTTDQNPNNYLRQLSSPPASQAGSSQARVNSMVERARIAKVPLPEAALNCPRCDSTNTKFCYFNNYSLTQPRHFCKTCRRYWTRGGALRNVPVGGGFRRNKRSKSNGQGGRSKSTVVVSADNNTPTSSLTSQPSYSNPSKFLSYGQIPGLNSNLPILPPFQSLGDYSSTNIGLNFGGIQISNVVSGMSSSTGGILDPWRIPSSQQAQQFPFLINTTGLVQSSNALYPVVLQGNEVVNQADPQQKSSDYSNQLMSKPLMDLASCGDGASESRNVKAEENDQDRGRDGDRVNNISRNFLGNININSSAGNNEYTSWGGNNSSWTGFTSNNSTGHLSF